MKRGLVLVLVLIFLWPLSAFSQAEPDSLVSLEETWLVVITDTTLDQTYSLILEGEAIYLRNAINRLSPSPDTAYVLKAKHCNVSISGDSFCLTFFRKED